MAALTITPLDCEEADKTGVAITATLTDSAGNKIAGHVTGGQIVNQTRAVSNGATVTLDLTPNADIDPGNSYYTVKIGPFSFLIEKTSGTQTLRQALAEDTVPLTPSVATQLVDAAFAEVVTDGEVTGPLDGLTIATGAVVAGKLGTSAVTTTKIQDDAVTTAKIATGAVTSAELGADSVTTAAIAPDAVTANEIADDAVGTAQIAALAVGTSELAASSATIAKLGADVITRFTDVESGLTTETFNRAVVDALLEDAIEVADGALGLPEFLPLLTALRSNRRHVNVLVMGDSTVEGDDLLKWPGKVFAWLQTQFPAYTLKMAEVLASAPYETFDTATTRASGSGSFDLTVWNASISGTRSDTMFGAGRFAGLLNSHTVDLVIFCHGHNEGDISMTPEFGGSFAISGNANNGVKQSGEQFISRCASVIEQVRNVQPQAPVVVIASNPELSGTADDQDHRTTLLARMAALLGYGFIDVAPALRANAGWSTSLGSNTLMTDSLHPNEAGHTVMATAIQGRIKTNAVGGSGSVRPSFFERPSSIQLLSNAHLLQTTPGTIDSPWSASSVTVTKDATYYEGVKAYAARLDATGSAASSIAQTLATATITPYLGRWVTAAARVRVPPLGRDGTTAQDMDSVGSLRVYCNPQYLTYSYLHASWRPLATDAATNNGWHWLVVPVFVPTGTTSIVFTLYAGLTSADSNARIYVDRCSVVPGIWPGEPA